jgi:hypothetical protein
MDEIKNTKANGIEQTNIDKVIAEQERTKTLANQYLTGENLVRIVLLPEKK